MRGFSTSGVELLKQKCKICNIYGDIRKLLPSLIAFKGTINHVVYFAQ